VNDGVHVASLNPLVQREHHVVAQVVEAELVVGAVRDVRAVRSAASIGTGVGVVETANRETEVVVQVAHPLRVTPGQVRVDGDQVGSASGERVQVERQRGYQRLSFTR